MSHTSVTLRLRSVDDFFHAPHIDPRSEWFEEYSLSPGLQYVVEEVADTPRTAHVSIEIQLPAEAIDDALAEAVTRGMTKYCDARLREIDNASREDRSRGWLMMAVSVVVVFVLIWIAQLFYDRGLTPLVVAAEGLSIAAWMMLWHPLEHLVFNRWDHRLDRRVLCTVRDRSTITITPLPERVPTA
jgi:hypothetical protein